MALEGTCAFSQSERDLLLQWLRPTWTRGSEAYVHARLDEDRSLRDGVRPLLLRYIAEAHKDAREFFSKAYGRSVDPRRDANLVKAYSIYPAFVEQLTLAGFFGEVLSGLIADLHAPHKLQWRVPAYGFRFHDNLFRSIVGSVFKGQSIPRAVGRTGDDCLAFAVTDGVIQAVLVCEAKCSYSHSASLLDDGFSKLASTVTAQLEFFKIVQILLERRRVGDSEWAEAILTFRDSGEFQKESRYDLLSYTHGQKPKLKASWIDPNNKHEKHASDFCLAAVEVHLADIEAFVTSLYNDAFVQ